jgi:hypothetical protein
MKATPAITEDSVPLSPRLHFRAAMVLAMAADALQIFVFPIFAEGALSPADDVLDLAVAAVLVNLLGWHWEFLPAFAAELVPGVDLVPFWTLAVGNVYRKWKQMTITVEDAREQRPALPKPQNSSLTASQQHWYPRIIEAHWQQLNRSRERRMPCTLSLVRLVIPETSLRRLS